MPIASLSGLYFCPLQQVLLVFLQSIDREVELATRTMLAGLVEQLQSDVQLTDCLRIVGHLRTLQVGSMCWPTRLSQLGLRCLDALLMFLNMLGLTCSGADRARAASAVLASAECLAVENPELVVGRSS